MPPTPRPPRTLRSSAPVATRGRWTRSNGDMLTGGSYVDPYPYSMGPGIDPGSQPAVHWMGLDTGALSGRPIGPNGPWPSGYGGALPVVTRATSLITGPLTAAPFRTQELGFGGRPLGRPRWITDPCTTRSDSRFPTDTFAEASKLTRGNFWATWIRHACHFGTGAFLAVEDEKGQPVAGTLRIVDPLLLDTERASDGSLRWVLGSEGAAPEDRVVFGRNGRVTLGGYVYRIVVLRNPHASTSSDGYTPGVFESHPSTFNLGGSIDAYAQGTFRSGIPAGYLQTDASMTSMTQEQADELKRRWMSAHGGDRRSIAVLNSFTRFVPLQMSPVDSALGEVKRLNVADVAFAFGLDPYTLGVSLGNSATYNNLRDAWTNHRDFGLAPWIAAVQDTLTALLPGNQGVLVDLDRFVNPPAKERYDGYKVAIDAGILTVDEVRELEGIGPKPPDAGTDETRALSQQEAVQKVYLGVTNGIITREEARQMINDAGGKLDVDAPVDQSEGPEEQRHQPWR